MNLTDYQAFCRTTAIYPEELRVEYPALGVISEVGELCGKYKKILRDKGGVISDADREAMLDECGDVLWYCATIASDCDVQIDHIKMPELKRWKPTRVLLRMAKWVGKLSETVETILIVEEAGFTAHETLFKTYLKDIIAGLRFFAYSIGCSRKTVGCLADRNAAKLTARKAKGTLSGSGDER